MLNFKLKPNAIDKNSTTPLIDYLKSFGIVEIEEFIKIPSKKNEIHGSMLENSMSMVTKLCKLFDENKKFFLIVDCDTDGFTSSAIFYNFFKTLYPKAQIEWMLHEEKQHGIELDKVPADCDVIIVPDAGSNQIDEINNLINSGKYVFILDHHQVEYELPNHELLYFVNNQTSPRFENKALSGAGVVFKIIQLFEEVFYNSQTISSQLYDLAALGILADCMDSRTLDNNYIIYKGLHNINNKMFKALVDKQNYSIQKELPNKMDVSFYIAPLINGTIRMGTMEDKELLFRGFIEQNHDELYEHTWRGNTTMEDFYHRSARIAYNVKNEQNRIKMKCLEFLSKRIEEEGLDKNKIIAVITHEDDDVPVPKTITGLVAMELLKLYGKPALVLRQTTDKNGVVAYSGSGRSNSFEELPSFLAFVREQEESLYAQGHSCAFGASILAEEFDNFIVSCNEKMAHIDFANDTIMVDAIFDNKINHQLIHEFAKGGDIYGNQIDEPKIVLQHTITSSDIMIMGSDASSLRITIGGIPCIKFKCRDLIDKLKSSPRNKVTIIGKPKLNYFRGTENAQIMIDTIDIEPVAHGGLF